MRTGGTHSDKGDLVLKGPKSILYKHSHVAYQIKGNEENIYIYTVDSRYLDPSYLDPITYVELISKSRLFSLCIYCISASRISNYFYVDTSAISSIIFSP